MAVTKDDTLDLLLLVGGEEFQKATPNTAQAANRLPTAHRNVGSTLQGKSQQHFGVVQMVQCRMDTQYILCGFQD